MKNYFLGFFILLYCVSSSQALANTVVLNPTDDGFIGDNGNVVNNFTYLLTSGPTRGVTKFSLTDLHNFSIMAANLSVNPYGLNNLGINNVDLYGFGSNEGTINTSEYFAGTLLGTWVFPKDLGFGEKAFFDVTDFLKTVDTPYVGFNLRTGIGQTDLFSSLEYNYGSPSQLSVVVTPEPASMILFGAGGVAMAFMRRRKA